MREFYFYGEKIIFSDGQENYNRLRLDAAAAAAGLKQEFIERYQMTYRNMEQVVNGVFDLGEEYLRRAASWCVEVLGKHHVYTYDADRFLKSCTVSLKEWLGACDIVLDSYASVLANAALRDSVKQWQNSYHIKWLGETPASAGAPLISWMTGKPVPSSAADPQPYHNLVTLFNSGTVQEILGEGIRAAAAEMHRELTLLLQGQEDYPMEGLDTERLGDFSTVLTNISGGATDDAEILSQAASLMRLFPYSEALYFFVFDRYGDPDGSLAEMAEYVGLGGSVSEHKVRFAEERITSLPLTDYETLPSSREQVRELCQKCGIPADSYLSAIDALIDKGAVYDRNVDGFQYEETSDAQKAREQLQELFARTRGLTGNQEAEIQEVVGWLESCSCRTKDKYLDYLKEALARAEIRYRTVKNILFENRGKASEARAACLRMEELLAAPCTSIDAIRSLLDTARTLPSQISLLYTELLNAMLDVWNRQDILYSTKAMYRPETRSAYTALWYEALGLSQESALLGVGNESFNRWFGALRTDFLTVKGVLYENAKEANRSYFKVLSHAVSYKKYMDEKNNTKKGFFSSLKNSVSSLWAENYQDDFAWITANGTRFLPADTKEDGAALDAQYAAATGALDSRTQTLRQLLARVRAPHALQDEPLSLEPLMLPAKHLAPEEVGALLNPVLKYHALPQSIPQANPQNGSQIGSPAASQGNSQSIYTAASPAASQGGSQNGSQTVSQAGSSGSSQSNAQAASGKSSAKLCPACHAPLPENALFCSRCGTRCS